ncbi:CDP-alcohol phosphatidyltransferase family protein [Marivita sp.]|uniref:CDP-alcohol phosphatidyltransferase family protein n=1 Tax=Marivita sp. TaxID=2003365 RepID=UPI003F6AA1FF
MMALTQTHLIRDTRSRFIPPGPIGAFIGLSLMGVLCVLAFALVLPGASPVTVTTAVSFYATSATITSWFLKRDYPNDRLGLCNVVTLARLALVSALLVPLMAGEAPSWSFCAMAAFALSLDGIDGWAARRQGLVSEFGARFDVEVDSLLALVLALNAAFNAEIGAAVILLGLPRYVFALANFALPWMRRALPERFSRKVVCVVQLATLIAMQAPILPPLAAVVLLPLAAGALIWSFAIDTLYLWRSRA